VFSAASERDAVIDVEVFGIDFAAANATQAL